MTATTVPDAGHRLLGEREKRWGAADKMGMTDRQRGRRFGAAVLSAAIFLAPFLALIFSAEAGLAMMAAALGATTWLLAEAISAVPDRARPWIRLAIAVNLALAIACLALAIWLFAAS
jgi:hypothetical protein